MTLSTTAMDLHHILASPSAQYWLGTDELGRDVFARLLSSIGLSLSVSMGVLLCVAIFGIAFGLTSAWCGSKVDRIMMRIADIFLSIPGLLVAIAFASLMPAGALTVVVALSLTGWVGFARLSRIEALRFKQQDFMASARLSGVSVVRQLSIYILPNIAAPLLVEAAFTLSGVMMAEAGLSFLGIGIAPPTPSLGGMLREGVRYMLVAPHLVLASGCVLMLLVLTFNQMGDMLRRRLNRTEVK